jgi:deubiquitinating protein VCIP135
MQIFKVSFFFSPHAGGKKTLQQSYIRKLANAMDELFLQKFGVHPSLVCDMYQYNYKKPGV